VPDASGSGPGARRVALVATGSETPTLADDDLPPATGSTDPGPPGPSATLATGAQVGRYLVLAKIDEGGMGVVYAAYDPELDRKVALKVLGGRKDSEPMRSAGRARLLREAQALAKLSHPGVVAVHDVGTHAGDVFIAMELVDGKTLGKWLQETPRTWSQILPVLIAAGHGLAAAHAVGIVHRDFKPDNVMIDGSGRARVLDFGLARAEDGARLPTGPRSAVPVAMPLSLSQPLTIAGAWLGTPAYMAPEQFSGDPIDPRTDQFGFCVTAWHALYGMRPFPGHDAFSLSTAVIEGRFATMPGDRRVPGFVRRALVRGLASRPDDRWPSMEALLAELGRDRIGRRRRWTLVGGLGAGAVALAMLAGRAPEPCRDGPERLSQTWSEATAAELGDAFGAIGPTAAEAWPRVEARLDAWASDWVGAYEDACAATRVHHTQSEALLDLRMACLDERRRSMHALVEALRTPDDATVERAIDATATLQHVEACADYDALQSRVPPPDDPEIARDVDAARGELATITALAATGKELEARTQIVALRERAETLGHAPLLAEVERSAAILQYGHGDPAEAASLQKSAYFRARASGHDVLARDAAISLVLVLGTKQNDLEAALQWAEHARAELSRSPDARAEAELETSVGSSHRVAGAFEAAERHLRRALELPVEDDAVRVNVLTSLANVLSEGGTTDETWAISREAIALCEDVYGPEHPRTAMVLHNYASALVIHGKHDEALEPAERAVRIWQRARPGSTSLAEALTSLGLVRLRAGQAAEGVKALHEALAITERLLGPRDQHAAKIHGNLGLAHQEAGDHRRAAEEFEAAHAIFTEVYGPDHPLVGMVRSNLGIAYEALGQTQSALDHSRDALRILERAFGADDPRLADTKARIARLQGP
jgi:tetratricopeptide (TPR) repeat protein/predicted Ser/Thr protein kinase